MNFIQFITTRRFLKHLALSILLFIAIVWVVLLTLKFYTRHSDIAVTPNYIGMTMTQVGGLESSRDFKLLVVDSIYDYTRKPGTIVSQDPLPNTKVKPGRTVYLSLISFRPEQISMPELIDLSLRQGKALLQTYGLKLGNVRVVPDLAENAILKATINGHVVKPGTLIPKGSLVDLMIGSGSGAGQPAIPFLIGKTRDVAVIELKRAGFKIGNESYSGDSDSTNARVYEQEPKYVYGKRIDAGTSFTLTYKASTDLDFDEYIRSMVIDTIAEDKPLP